MTAELNFVRQQGFKDASPETCVYQYPALMWQPRAISGLVLVGLVLQSWHYFLGLSALLWWNVALPRLNVFDVLYNYLVANRKASLAWTQHRALVALRNGRQGPSCSRSGSPFLRAGAPWRWLSKRSLSQRWQR